MNSENVNCIVLSPRSIATGSPVGDALENVITSPLADGALCYVKSGVGQGLWELEKGASTAANGTTIVAPIAGGGRWFKKLVPGVGPASASEFATFDTAPVPIPINENTRIAQDIAASWATVLDGAIATARIQLTTGRYLAIASGEYVSSGAGGSQLELSCVGQVLDTIVIAKSYTNAAPPVAFCLTLAISITAATADLRLRNVGADTAAYIASGKIQIVKTL